MILHARLGAVMVGLAPLLMSTVQAQDQATSRYTTAGVAVPQCKQAQAPVEGFSCTGIAGWVVNIGYPAFGATVHFGRGKRQQAAHAPTDGRQVDIDDIASKETKIEWRGVVRGNLFEPYAAIIRVRALDAAQRQAMIEQGVSLPQAQRAQFLTVVKLGREGSCVIAYVDAQANPKPNDLARMAADTEASKSTCPVQVVKIVGTRSPILDSYMK